MPWTETARGEYRRACARYASDMTDREWGLVAAFMPPPRRLGRPRTTDLREVMNAILYIATTGCQWVQLRKDFPPCSTVQRYFHDWRDSGLLQTMRFALAMETRETGVARGQPERGDNRQPERENHRKRRGLRLRRRQEGQGPQAAHYRAAQRQETSS